MIIGYLEDIGTIVGELQYPTDSTDSGGNTINTYIVLDADVLEVDSVLIGSTAGTISQAPPITFVSGSTKLLDFVIYGNIGGVGTLISYNLFDEQYPEDTSVSITYIPVYVGEGNFTLSTNMPLNSDDEACLFFLSGDVYTGVDTEQNGVWNGNARSQASTDGYVTIAYNHEEKHPKDYHVMLNGGISALAYTKAQCQISVTVRGKNLFDKTNAVILNGYVNASGIWVDDDNCKSIMISCSPSTDYTLSKMATDICAAASFANAPDDQDVAIAYSVGENTDKRVSLNSGVSAGYLVFSIAASEDYVRQLSSILDSIMIEQGIDSSEYDPSTDCENYIDQTSILLAGAPPLQLGKEFVVDHSALPDIVEGTNIITVNSDVQPMCVMVRYIERV